LFYQEDEHVIVSSLVGQAYKAKSVIIAIPPHLAGEHMDPGRGDRGGEERERHSLAEKFLWGVSSNSKTR